MTNFPMTFRARAATEEAGIHADWGTWPEAALQRDSGLTEIKVSIPTEFGGPGVGQSPEDLYAMALLNCFICTFQVYSKNSRLTFTQLAGAASLTLDLNDRKMPCVKAVNFEIELLVSSAENVAKADKLLKKVSENCILINSVQAEKTFNFKVVSEDSLTSASV